MARVGAGGRASDHAGDGGNTIPPQLGSHSGGPLHGGTRGGQGRSRRCRSCAHPGGRRAGGDIGRIARLALLAQAAPKGPSQAAGVGGAGTPAAEGSTQPPTESCAKVKLSTVLDQGDDSEVKPLNVDALRGLIVAWKATYNDGEDPAPNEEATGDQISALSFRLRSGATPYVDFGIWRPHGGAIGRIMKFTAHVAAPGGEFHRKEVTGPSSFAEWENSWRVYAFAMEVLDAASRTRLKRYYDQVQRLANDYPSMWWIIACADIKMRQMHFERIRRRLVKEHADLTAAGLPSDFNPTKPWDLVVREAARDTEYWHSEVDKKVVQYVTSLRSQSQLTDPGCGAIVFAGERGAKRGLSDDNLQERAKSKKQKTQQKDKVRPDGLPPARTRDAGPRGRGRGSGGSGSRNNKHFKTDSGVEVCWAWNRSATGCTEPCPKARAHVCERCRGDHRAVQHGSSA